MTWVDRANGDAHFAVRDLRDGNWFWVHNALLDGEWGAAIGPYGIAVYNAIARYANNGTQQAYPSYNTLVRLTGMSRNKAIDAVDELEQWNIIQVQPRSKGKEKLSNLITLIDPAFWKRQVQYQNRSGRWIEKDLDQVDATDKSSTDTGVSGGLGGSQVGLDVVHECNHPGASSGLKQDSLQDSIRQDELTIYDVNSQFAGELRILASLIRYVAPSFRSLDQWMDSLSEQEIERLAVALFDLLSRQDKAHGLLNPAGYLKACVSDEYEISSARHEAKMLEYWQTACELEDRYANGEIDLDELNVFWRKFGIAKPAPS